MGSERVWRGGGACSFEEQRRSARKEARARERERERERERWRRAAVVAVAVAVAVVVLVLLVKQRGSVASGGDVHASAAGTTILVPTPLNAISIMPPTQKVVLVHKDHSQHAFENPISMR